MLDTLRTLAPWATGIGLAALLDRIRAYQPRPSGLADNLQWAAVAAPGVLQNRDRALSRTWRYQGVDTRVASPRELNRLSGALNRALSRLGSGCMVHLDAIRRPVVPPEPGPHFPSPLSRFFDEERYALFSGSAAFESQFFLTLTLAAPEQRTETLQRLFVEDPTARLGQQHSSLILRLDEISDALEAQLGRLLSLRRLTSVEQLSYFHRCLTGLDHPIAEPAAGHLVANALSDQELIGGWKPRIGNLHIRVVRLNAYPSTTTQPAMLDPLTDLPCAYRWSTRLLIVSPEEADKKVKNLQWMWYARRQDARTRLRRAVSANSAAPDPDEREIFEDRSARAMATDSAELLERLHGHTEVLCAYTTKVVIHAPHAAEAEATAADCIQALTRRGFGAALESSNTLDGWLGSLPAHGTADLRRDPIPSLNVADLLPVTGSWSGHATVPSRYFPENSPALMWTFTEGATPFRFNLHTQDVFHALLLGPTGAGKSYLTSHLALQFLRYPRAQVFVFDKGYSSFLPCLAAGGVHYDIASARKASLPFQPLRHIDDEAERTWAVGWLDTLLRLQGLETRAAERGALERALHLVATEEPDHRTLDALLIQLADPRIQGHLRPYCEGGSLERLLNGSRDPLEESHFLAFELGHILDADPRALVPVQLYLAHALAKRRSQARPTLLIWDEAWRALEDPYCRGWIKNDLATARKQNCGVVLITQSIAQLVEPELRTLVDEAAQTKVYLPNPAATKPETRQLYQALGLSERQCHLVATMTPKRDYLYASREGTRLFQLGSTELAEALLSPPPNTTEEALVDRIHALREQEGDGWLPAYLRQRGCEHWAERLEKEIA